MCSKEQVHNTASILRNAGQSPPWCTTIISTARLLSREPKTMVTGMRANGGHHRTMRKKDGKSKNGQMLRIGKNGPKTKRPMHDRIIQKTSCETSRHLSRNDLQVVWQQ